MGNLSLTIMVGIVHIILWLDLRRGKIELRRGRFFLLGRRKMYHLKGVIRCLEVWMGLAAMTGVRGSHWEGVFSIVRERGLRKLRNRSHLKNALILKKN